MRRARASKSSTAGLGRVSDWPAEHRNLARYLFLHPAARDLFTDWDR